MKFIFFLYSRKYIIHFYNNLGSYSVNRLLNIFPSTNIIFHERGTVWNAKDEDYEVYRNNSSKANVIIANSNASKLMLIKRFGIDENKIKVIYNGFYQNYNFDYQITKRYTDKFTLDIWEDLIFPRGSFLINSAKKLQKYNFFVAGRGVLENNLRELAKSKNINFIGSVKDPLKFISKMDIMVVPSVREPLGNTIIEVLYCKTSYSF